MRFHMLQAAKKLSTASFIFHLGTNWSQSVIFQTGMKTNSFFLSSLHIYRDCLWKVQSPLHKTQKYRLCKKNHIAAAYSNLLNWPFRYHITSCQNIFLSLHNGTETRINHSTVMFSQFWGNCKLPAHCATLILLYQDDEMMGLAAVSLFIVLKR